MEHVILKENNNSAKVSKEHRIVLKERFKTYSTKILHKSIHFIETVW